MQGQGLKKNPKSAETVGTYQKDMQPLLLLLALLYFPTSGTHHMRTFPFIPGQNQPHPI
jgi:hypothetical protein